MLGLYFVWVNCVHLCSIIVLFFFLLQCSLLTAACFYFHLWLNIQEEVAFVSLSLLRFQHSYIAMTCYVAIHGNI